MLHVLIFQALIGLTPLFITFVNPHFSAALLVFLRYSFSSVFFLLLIVMRKHLLAELLSLSPKKLFGLSILGILGSGLGSLLYVLSIRLIGISLSSTIQSLDIPISILLAVVFLKEKLTKSFIMKGIIVLVGFYLLTITGNTFKVSGNTFFLGVFIAFLNAVVFGVASLLGKKLLQVHTSPTIVAFFRQGLGAMTNLFIALITFQAFSSVLSLQLKDWGAITFLGIFTGGIGYILYYKALHVLEVKKISLFFISSTVVSVLAGIAIGERLSIIQWVGVGITLAGITLFLREKTSTVEEVEEEQV